MAVLPRAQLLARQREDEVEVPDGQHALRARSDPLLLRERLALGAMTVAALSRPGRRPRFVLVERGILSYPFAMVAPALNLPVDSTLYPVEEEMGEHELQTYVLEVLRPLLARFLAGQGVRAHVGSDQFIYWEQNAPTRCVAPDLYVLPGVTQELAIDVWKVWETRVVPSFALEVVTSDYRKDYEAGPKRYEELGVDELLVFDPLLGSAERVTFQMFRRTGEQGFCVVEHTMGDRVWSEQLGCWFRVVGEGHAARLRIAIGPRGDELLPTFEEMAEQALAAKERERSAKEQERSAKEQERSAKEQERSAKEQERAAKEQALALVATLEAEIARLKG